MQEKIEILSIEIFKTHEKEMGFVETIKRELNWEIGWHYHLDLAWMLREVGHLPPGSLILDAGAGRGLAQFLLSELGYNVISIDLTNRFNNFRKVKKYGPFVHNLNEATAFPKRFRNSGIYRTVKFFSNIFKSDCKARNKLLEIISLNKYKPALTIVEDLQYRKSSDCGRIFVYKSDLKNMALLPNNFVDAVISISALEHNNHQGLKLCLNEMMRVSKPGSALIMTVSASQSEDWFHEPSRGWCYSESSLRNLFQLSDRTFSNFNRKDEFMNSIKKEGNELHKRLDSIYFRSGDNGMPWGKWDPRYQPVGVVKHKQES
ncbi:MAG: methyltransferase domain-containing protein [Thermodesulfobacteriota bacterium]